MVSKNREATKSSGSSSTARLQAPRKRRRATVYDAVAGRVAEYGFIQDTSAASNWTAMASSKIAKPEEVLFRRKNAPVRYEETDFYFASDKLQPGVLPESDLLKALHAHTADYYSRTTSDRRKSDHRSMDGTALLALGILMEELCQDALGDTGDLVFTEGIPIDEEDKEAHPLHEETGIVARSDLGTGQRPRAKRRKLTSAIQSGLGE